MHRDDNPLDWLADEEGRLLDERNKFELFRGAHTVLVPFNVQLTTCPSQLPWAKAVPCIRYPVPQAWEAGARDGDVFEFVDMFELIASGDWGWEHGERVTAEGLLKRVRKGGSGTWGGANPSGLLNDFLRLAHEGADLGSLSKRVIDRVVAFVQHWGPLWMCRTPDHHVYRGQCFWDPQQGLFWGRSAKPCSWRPVEEVRAFVREARRAKAVIWAAGRLRQGRRVEAELWKDMGVRWPPIQDQWHTLIKAVSHRLALHGRLQLDFVWFPPKGTPPKLHLRGPMGFIHVVWTEIAQLLCNAKGVYVCDACGKPYIREGRQPKAGQRQYCPTCAAGNRAAARNHMRQRRHQRGENPTHTMPREG
jgi:DNA-directed RNA polymerase subunit RPC12/RpoP